MSGVSDHVPCPPEDNAASLPSVHSLSPSFTASDTASPSAQVPDTVKGCAVTVTGWTVGAAGAVVSIVNLPGSASIAVRPKRSPASTVMG